MNVEEAKFQIRVLNADLKVVKAEKDLYSKEYREIQKKNKSV